MTTIVLDYIAGVILNFSNPAVLIDLGLATVHMIAAHFYMMHPGGRPLACCSSIASAFYLLQAYLHSLAH